MTFTPQFNTGFETGLLNTAGLALIDVATAGMSVDTTAPRSGAYSLHCVAPVTTACNCYKLITGTPTKVLARFALQIVSLPASGSCQLAMIFPTSGVQSSAFSVDSAGVPHWGAQTSAALSTGKWYVIELQIDFTNNPWVTNWKINGVFQTAGSVASAATTGSRFYLGNNLATSQAFTALYDDWIFGTYTSANGAAGDWIGDGQGLAHIAGVDGTHTTTSTHATEGDAGTAITSGTSNANTMVNDAPPWTTVRSTTNNIALRAIATTEYVEIGPAPTAQGGVANAVRALVAVSAPAVTAVTAGLIARNSAGAAVVVKGDLPVAAGGGGGAQAGYAGTTNSFAAALVTTPAAGWKAAEVNAVRWRFGESNSNTLIPTIQTLMLEVDWAVPPLTPPLLAHRQAGRDVLGNRGPTGGRF